MKHFFLSSAFLLLFQAFGNTAQAQTGQIDLLVTDGILNAARTQWTFKIQMKEGLLYTPNWSAMKVIVDVDYGTIGTAPTIQSVSQVLTSEATTPTQSTSAVGNPLPGHELEMTINYSNPGGAAGDLTASYKTFTNVTVTFSSPVGPDAVFTVRDFANNTINIQQARSNWVGDVNTVLINETAGQNPDGSALTATPLNISLLSFNATATPERTAKLEWTTAAEKNSSHFLVERSSDGLRFTDQVARMQAAGISNEELNYHTFDTNPLTGANYYRLKMVNKDGSYKYSETRRLVFEAPVADVTAIPNPFQSATTIRVNADRAQMANYYVMDATGRVIRTGVWEVAKGVQEFPMPLNDAAAGNYILTVQGSTILAELKLVKTN